MNAANDCILDKVVGKMLVLPTGEEAEVRSVNVGRDYRSIEMGILKNGKQKTIRMGITGFKNSNFKGQMKKNVLLITCLSICLSIGLGGCKSRVSTKMDYTFTLKDSLVWEREMTDSLVKVPYSIVNMVVNPSKMEDGEKKETNKGQANLSIEKKGDTIFIEASCDSLELTVKSLRERLSKVSEENENLKEEVKAAPNRLLSFMGGIGMGAFTVLIALFILLKITKRI